MNWISKQQRQQHLRFVWAVVEAVSAVGILGAADAVGGTWAAVAAILPMALGLLLIERGLFPEHTHG